MWPPARCISGSENSSITRYPTMQAWLPPQWPRARTSAIDRAATITALRQATSTLNHGLLILGYGDGTIIEMLRQDPVARGKVITIIVLASELTHFVSSLGFCDITSVCSALQLHIQIVTNADDLSRFIITTFAAHHHIASSPVPRFWMGIRSFRTPRNCARS
jgi:hypothetical protein